LLFSQKEIEENIIKKIKNIVERKAKKDSKKLCEIFINFGNFKILLIIKTEQINKYATPNQYIGIAYIAKRLPIKKLNKRNTKGEIKISDLLKLKKINIMMPRIPMKTIHSLFSPKIILEYSEKSSFWSSVIVLNVSGKNKLTLCASFTEKFK